MGQSIIFVGGANLNRNSDNQSMYKQGYSNRYRNNLTPSRDQFYKELCEECKTFPGKKKRNKKISKLRSKYQASSCSESTMEKVFISYLECFGRKMGQLEYRKKVVELPIFLERNKVDRRIIKRIMKIEKIDKEKPKKESKENYEDLMEIKKKRVKKFHELLNIYLIECTHDEDIPINIELEELLNVYNRSPEYIDNLKAIYRKRVKSELSLSKISKKGQYSISRTDKLGLEQAFNSYKNYIS